MKFVDEATIRVQAGKGGDGSASFRREKFVPFGGPDGGDGGRGGSVIFEGDSGLNTLVDFRHLRQFKAQNGEQGRGRQMTGKGGEDIVVRVPLGTVITDEESGESLGEVTTHGELLIIARGGKGGLGNLHFKSSTNRAPRQTVPGQPGEARALHLELKVLADVGLLGFPNAGKSTLLNALTKSDVFTEDLLFATLDTSTRRLRFPREREVIITDTVGFIRSLPKSLMGAFKATLEELQDADLLLHVVDAANPRFEDQIAQVRAILGELELGDKAELLVFNKADLLDELKKKDTVAFLRVRQAARTQNSVTVSARDRKSLAPLVEELQRRFWTEIPDVDPIQTAS